MFFRKPLLQKFLDWFTDDEPQNQPEVTPTGQFTYVLLTDEGRHEWGPARRSPTDTADFAESDFRHETTEHVTALMAGRLGASAERFRKWWIEDENGTVIESHDELAPTVGRYKRRRIKVGESARE